MVRRSTLEHAFSRPTRGSSYETIRYQYYHMALIAQGRCEKERAWDETNKYWLFTSRHILIPLPVTHPHPRATPLIFPTVPATLHHRLVPQQDYLDENQDDEEAQQQQPRFFDNPALDQAQLHLDTIYFATARPRFEANPACLRRQRDNASAAAGALSNSLGGNDSWTNQQPRPTDTVGEERAEALRLGTSLLIR